MGFKRKAPKVFKVAFAEGHEFEGLEMSTRALSTQEFAAIGLRMQAVGASLKDAGTPDEAVAGIETFIVALAAAQEVFAGALISWNYEEEDGTPIPATLEGVRTLDEASFFNLINEWLEAIGGVDADLGKDSSSGPSSPELSIPMELSSPSQTN